MAVAPAVVVPQSGSFPFLTPERQQVFRTAVRAACMDYERFAVQEAAIFQTLDPRELANLRRMFLVAQLKRHFAGMMGVETKTFKLIFMIIFDGTDLVHFKKLDPFTRLGMIPKTLSQGIDATMFQPELPFEDLEEVVVVQDLHDVIGGYILNEAGIIAEFCFNDQEGEALLAQFDLDLSEADVSVAPREEKPTRKAQFKPKATDKDDTRAEET
jgi:hypothetical protein